MDSSRAPARPPLLAAMLCSAVVMAQFIAAKATRDAIFLANHDITTLPAMVIAAAGFSILLVTLNSQALRRLGPATFMPRLCVASGLGLLATWALVRYAPRIAAPLLYLQISGVGPMLGSGFWLIASERFDPRTAKRRFGQVAGAGTLGGLAGGLVAERVAAITDIDAMLPILALLSFVSAWQLRQLAGSPSQAARPDMLLDSELAVDTSGSGIDVLVKTPYLRDLATLVLLGTIGATLVDYVFKAHAVSTFGRSDTLLRFFALYYAGGSLVTFALQTSLSRIALEKAGLPFTTATPSLALFLGGIGSLVAPGFGSAIVARAGESVFRGSLFRSAYELLYTPIPVAEKRAAKSVIDVGVDRFGDAVGGGLIRVLLVLAPLQPRTAILTAAVGCSAAALLVASRVGRGYIKTLERSLLNRAVELELGDVADTTTRSTMFRTLSLAHAGSLRSKSARPRDSIPIAPGQGTRDDAVDLDPEVLQIIALRSRQRDRVLRVLESDEGLPAPLIPHVIPLLAWDAVSGQAVTALRRVAEERIGQLIDALLDPNNDFAIRRRLARAFSVCVSQRAVDGLLLGLDDMRFEVRYQCARSLAAIFEKNPRVRIDADRIYTVVLREAAVGRSVWDSQRLLFRSGEAERPLFVDEFLKERANRSLAHVFTLLALVLPSEPLQIAYRGLHTADPAFRGTALEYLEGVLPHAIHDALWQYLDDPRPPRRAPVRDRDEVVADLLRSHPSIVLNLNELNARALEQRSPRDPIPPGARQS